MYGAVRAVDQHGSYIYIYSTRAVTIYLINIQSRNVKTKAASHGQSFGSGFPSSAQANPQRAPDGRYSQGPPQGMYMPTHVTPPADSRGGVTLRDVTQIPRCWKFLDMGEEKKKRGGK